MGYLFICGCPADSPDKPEPTYAAAPFALTHKAIFPYTRHTKKQLLIKYYTTVSKAIRRVEDKKRYFKTLFFEDWLNKSFYKKMLTKVRC